MNIELWKEILRKKIGWFPKICYGKCDGCMMRVKKCTRGAYVEKDGELKTTKPDNCVVGCTGCHSVCPQNAISHPPKSYLEKLPKRGGITAGCQCGNE